MNTFVSSKQGCQMLLCSALTLTLLPFAAGFDDFDRCTSNFNDNGAGDATLEVPNYRSISNKVSGDFEGTVEICAVNNGNTFTVQLAVNNGQAWPRISVGVITDFDTPGYPYSVDDYIWRDGGELKYDGIWTENAQGVYNGAYIWLNEPDNYYNNEKKYPRWVFDVEINIWNRHDNGIPEGTTMLGTYYDTDGTYQVHGKNNPVEGQDFYAYYVLLDRNSMREGMHINTIKLLKFLKEEVTAEVPVRGDLDIIDISVAAEGHKGADGRYVAYIQDFATLYNSV